MKVFLFLFALLFLPLVHNAFADDVYRGDTYQDIRSSEIIDGKIKHTWTGGLPPYFETNNTDQYGRKIFVPYLYTDSENSKIIESAGVSFKINQNTCTMQLYNNKITQNSVPVIEDVSYTLQEKINNTWRNSDHNNYSCLITVNQSPNEIQIITKQGDDVIGFKEIEYRLKNTELEVFLRSPFDSLGGKQYGFAESHVKVQDMFIKSTKFDVNSPDTTISKEAMRQTIENTQSDIKVITKNQGGVIFFDAKDTIHNTLTDVKIKTYTEDKLQTVYDYHNTQVLTQGTRLEIDPVFSATPTNENSLEASDATPANCNGKTYSGLLGNTRITYDASICRIPFFSYNISSIPTTSTALSASWTYDIVTSTSVSGNCYPFDFTNNPTGSQVDYDAVFTAAGIATPTNGCTTISDNKVFTMNSTGISKIQSNISGGEGFYALGVWFVTEPTSTEAAFFRTSDALLTINYVINPVSISDLSCNGQLYNYSCSWTPINASNVTGYYIQTSSNNSTWYGGNQTLVGNVTSGVTSSIYGIGDLNYIRVNGTYGSANSTSSNVVTATTDNYPSAPTIVATAASKSQINIVRTAGTSDGGNTITNYDLRCELNNTGGWLSTVINGTIANFYNYTGLAQNDSLTCQWRDRNEVGYSPYSSNSTSQTYSDTVATISFSGLNIGDVFNGTSVVTITNANPTPVTVSSIKILQNGTVVATEASSQQIAEGGSYTFRKYYLISDGNPHSYQMRFTISNNTNTIDFTSSMVNMTREYNPSYFIAEDPTQGLVNYTFSRSSDQNQLNLKANRDYSGNTFNIECLYRTTTEASLNTGGTWHNYSSVGYMNDTLSPAIGNNYYIDCYNDGLLFTVISYTNSSLLLSGIEVFDNTYGTFIGVPVGVFFVVLIAGMANQRTAPMWIVVILAVAGIMSAIGFFTLETNVWALALIAALLGIIVGRKLF